MNGAARAARRQLQAYLRATALQRLREQAKIRSLRLPIRQNPAGLRRYIHALELRLAGRRLDDADQAALQRRMARGQRRAKGRRRARRPRIAERLFADTPPNPVRSGGSARRVEADTRARHRADKKITDSRLRLIRELPPNFLGSAPAELPSSRPHHPSAGARSGGQDWPSLRVCRSLQPFQATS